jgi:arylsulfatase A-like enzyme
MNVICLAVDRLNLGHLGAYGNAWINTPAIDRLASEAVVFDQALIDSPQLETLYRSYWHGWHALRANQPPEDRPSLAAMLRDAGISTALLTDERFVGQHPLAVDFDELVEIDPPWQPQVADDIEQSHLTKCFAQAIGWLEAAEEPFLLWCHLAGLGTSWDAPLDFRGAYWEEGDPEPLESADVPDRLLPPDPDPDELLGIAQAYAGQVTLLDTCLGALLEYLRSSSLGQETLLVLTSPRGFPLGEHGRIGPCDEALYGEIVHVPLLMRFPDGLGASVRSPALVEPADLWATLLDWLGIADVPAAPTAASLLPLVRGDMETVRDRLCLLGRGTQRAIRTPAWYLRAGGTPELFVKPDDRREVNDVAVRCPEVVECLLASAAEYEQTVQHGHVADLPPLADVLLNGME